MDTRITSARCPISCASSTCPSTARRSPSPSRAIGFRSRACSSARISDPTSPATRSGRGASGSFRSASRIQSRTASGSPSKRRWAPSSTQAISSSTLARWTPRSPTTRSSPRSASAESSASARIRPMSAGRPVPDRRPKWGRRYLAAAGGRKVALLGRSMVANVAVASEMGYLKVPEGLLVSLEDLGGLLARKQVILSTGSQGETHSAVSLIAAGEHKYVDVGAGDLVIFSSRVIPGNERVIGRAINALLKRGAEVLWEDVAFVHVSGHASQEDLEQMIALTRPKYFMPVHGEYRHLLQHSRLAEKS